MLLVCYGGDARANWKRALEELSSPRSVEHERGVPRVKRCAQHDPVTESIVNRVRVIRNVLLLLFLVVVMVMVVLRVSMHAHPAYILANTAIRARLVTRARARTQRVHGWAQQNGGYVVASRRGH
jgi:hypothetical protein